MSDTNMNLDIGLEVHSSGEELVDALTRKLEALNRQIRSINATANAVAKSISYPGKASAPTKDGTGGSNSTSARSALALDRASVAELKRKMTITSRMASQRQREERAAFADYRARMSFKAKADAADIRSMRSRAQEEARAFRQRMSFTVRMGRLAIQEQRKAVNEQARFVADAARQEAKRSRDVASSIRANARLEASEARRVDRERSARESARGRGFSNLRQGAGEARDGVGRVVRGAGAVSAVAAASTGAAIRRSVSTRMEVDSEETSLRIFSGQTQAQIVAARKTWLDNLSVTNGASIAEGIKTYGEVLKAGIKGADQVTDSIMKGAVGLELNVKETTKLAGLIDSNYGSASSPEKLKSALNAVAVAAREDPTQSNEIIEGVKRGFGALSTGNMTPEELTALVSGGQSVGIQPGKAGTFVATQAKRMSEGASKFLGPKQRKEFDYAARELGFGNARSMAQAYAKESYRSIMTVNEKLAAMAPDKRAQVADALYGTQWSDEGLQASQGVEGVRKTHSEIIDPKNSRFLDEAAQQRAGSLQGQWNSTKAIFGRFWDAFGSGFEDILTSINRYFLDLNASFNYDKVKGYVTDFMTGVREAFGVSTWKELFTQTFGGDLGNMGADIKAFGRGLADGILSIGRVIRSIMTAFGGSGAGAETIGRLSGQFVALSIALVALAPVVSILGGLVTIITGLAIAGRGLAGLVGLGAGAAAGAGAVGTGLMRGLGVALSRMFALSVVAEIGASRGVISTWLLDAGKSLLQAAIDGLKAAFSREAISAAMKSLVSEVIPAPLQRWMDSNGLEDKKSLPSKVLDGAGKPPVPVAPTERGIIGKAWDWLSSSLIGSAQASEMEGRPPANAPINRLRESVDENTAVLKQSFGSEVSGLGGLIHKAFVADTGSAQAVRSSMTDSAARVQSPFLSGSTGSGGFGGAAGRSAGPLSGSVPGSVMAQGGGRLSSRGIIGGSNSTPGTGITAPNMKGQGADNARKSYDFFRSKGLSHEATAGILASMKQESGFNPQARGDGGRAHGLFQHHPDRRAAIMKATGINMSTAGIDDQLKGAFWEMQHGDAGAQRALRILKQPGISAWDAGAAFVKNFERPARDERALRGAMAEGFAREFGTGGKTTSLGAGISGLGGAGQYDGLRVKGSQASAGGTSYAGITDLARQVQENLPGGVKHFSAFNDRYHQGTKSKHASGLAFDTTLIDAAKSTEAAEAIRNKIRAAGIRDDAFKVIDEYRNPSARSTGGHIHSQFNTAEAAKKYSDYIDNLKKGSGGDVAAKADVIKSSGWRPGLGDNSLVGSAPKNLGTDAPIRVQNTQPIGGGRSSSSAGGSGPSVHAPITIQGAGQDAESIANAVQRKLQGDMGRRTHDVETVI